MAVRAGGRDFEVGSFNVEKTIRLIDCVAALTHSSTSAQEFIEGWAEREAERQRVARAAEPEARREARRQAMEIIVRQEQPDFEDAVVALEVDRRLEDSGPSIESQLVRLVPFVWREAREEIVSLLVLAVVDNAAMEAADVGGQLDAYLREQRLFVKHQVSLAEAVQLLKALAVRVKGELADESLGEVVGGLAGAVGDLVGVVRGSESSEPSSSSASLATSDGAAARSSTEPPQASS